VCRVQSDTSNLLETFNDWTPALNSKNFVAVAYIDFAKAFDTVSHCKLVCKLESYSVCGPLPCWICSFWTVELNRRELAILFLLRLASPKVLYREVLSVRSFLCYSLMTLHSYSAVENVRVSSMPTILNCTPYYILKPTTTNLQDSLMPNSD